MILSIKKIEKEIEIGGSFVFGFFEDVAIPPYEPNKKAPQTNNIVVELIKEVENMVEEEEEEEDAVGFVVDKDIAYNTCVCVCVSSCPCVCVSMCDEMCARAT